MALSLAALLFNSCLKDDGRVFNAETVPNVAQFFNAGLGSFSKDAVTKSGLDTITYAVGVTAANPPSSPSTVTLAVDNSIVTAYNAANPAIVYLPVPPAAYKLASTSVTIPAGKNSTTTTVIIDRNQLDPTLSYMLPVKIAGISPSIPISANLGIHYFHIIGNDFAGAYIHDFIRVPAANFIGHTDTFFPDSPTQFEVYGGYYTANVRYVVSFTKTGTGSSATYSNFQISLNSSDVSSILTANNIAVTTAPSINGYDSAHQYSFAEALALFGNNTDSAGGFTWGANGNRVNTDYYHH